MTVEEVRVPVESVSTVWECRDCGTSAKMTAWDHVDIGEPLCGECQEMMEPVCGVVGDACRHGTPACGECKHQAKEV